VDPIDTLDGKILKGLQTNGRVKQIELARELGVAQSTLLERIRKLEDQGFIWGYKAIINPEKLGLMVQAFISVSLKHHEAEIIEQFEEAIHQTPDIRACYHLTGRLDYLVLVSAKDLKHLGELVKSKIAGLPGFGRAETFMIFSEIKSDQGFPIKLNPDSNSGQPVQTKNKKERRGNHVEKKADDS